MLSKIKVLRSILATVIVAVVSIVIGVGYAYMMLQPVNPDQTQTQKVVIAKGSSVKAIAAKLKQAGLIKNASLFTLLVRAQKLSDKLQAGTFQLSPNLSAQEIAFHLTQGTSDVWITLPEGWRSEEVARSLQSINQLTEFDQDSFLKLAAEYEGQIFPDTYLIPKTITSHGLVDLFTSTFTKKVQSQAPEFFQLSPADQKRILILASILEREAQGETDMAHVAGILQNRLDINMALQVDATLQYAKGYSQALDSWWVPPTSADKKMPSMFNTYLKPGLPPKPICNPGIAAIKAAMTPTLTQDLFYLHDRQGQIHYAKNLQQHNINVSTYLRGE